MAINGAGTPAVTEWTVPEYAPEGETFTVSWKTTGADAVEILRDGVVVHHVGV